MKTRLLFFVLAVALVASACVKVDMTINVADDGSAEISGIVALNADAFTELAEDFGEEAVGSRDDLCNEFTADQGLDDGGTELETKPYDKDGFCGLEFSGSLSAEQVATEMGSISGGSDVVLTREGDGWFFEMLLTEDALGTGDLEGAEDFFDVEDLFGEAEYVIRVRLPGTQVEHNADFIEGDGTVGWDIDLLNPPARLFLRTEPGEPITGGGDGGDDGGNTGLVILIVVLALAALGAAAYFLMRNKEPQADPVAGQDLGGAAPAAPPTGDFGAIPSPAADESVFGTPASAAAADAAAPATEPVQPQSLTPEPSPTEPVQPQSVTPEPSPTEPAVEPQPVTPEPSPTEPAVEPASPEPEVVSSPTPEEATGSPVWDPARGKYVQWDPAGNRWLAYDNDAGVWQPE